MTGAAFRRVSDDNIRQYTQEISRYPNLSPEREIYLFQRIRGIIPDGEGVISVESAKAEIINSHLRLVVRMVTKYYKNQTYLPLMDCIMEGNVGIMTAVNAYELDRDARFSTCAAWWIRSTITNAVTRRISLNHPAMTTMTVKRMRQIEKARRAGYVEPAAIAEYTGLKLSVIKDCLERSSVRYCSLEDTVSAHSEMQVKDTIEDSKPTPEGHLVSSQIMGERRRLFREAFELLKPREQMIITRRKLQDKPMTLADIAEECNVSKERIRQLETRAMNTIRQYIVRAMRQEGNADSLIGAIPT